MRAWPERKKKQARIEIIPMIDVMMFLLVFFVLISINVLPALGLRITPPTSSRPDQVTEKKRVTIGLEKDGKVFIDGKPAEFSEIPERLNALAEPDKKTVVVIAGDEGAALQSLVSVLDALKIAGVGSAQIVARPKK